MADVKEESKRYPLLEFEYDKGPYEKTLELSNQPGFVSYTSGNPDNYMHEGFGFSRGDDKKVLEHAVYLLKKKKSKRSRVPIKQYLQKLPKWGRFGVTSVTPFLLLPVHPEGCTPAHRT